MKNQSLRVWLKSLTLIAALMCASAAHPAEEEPQGRPGDTQVHIYLHDDGIQGRAPGLNPSPSFKSIFGVPDEGRILVTMPEKSGTRWPRLFDPWSWIGLGNLTQAEWQSFHDETKLKIMARLAEGARKGISQFEIHSQESVNILGYFCPWRQAIADRYAKVMLDVMSEVKIDMSRTRTVSVLPWFGSNAWNGWGKAIVAKGQSQPFSGLIIETARGSTYDIDKAAPLVHNNVVAITAAGDYIAMPDWFLNLPIIHSFSMVLHPTPAEFAAVSAMADRHPGITVLHFTYDNVKPFDSHVRAMNTSDAPLSSVRVRINGQETNFGSGSTPMENLRKTPIGSLLPPQRTIPSVWMTADGPTRADTPIVEKQVAGYHRIGVIGVSPQADAVYARLSSMHPPGDVFRVSHDLSHIEIQEYGRRNAIEAFVGVRPSSTSSASPAAAATHLPTDPQIPLHFNRPPIPTPLPDPPKKKPDLPHLPPPPSSRPPPTPISHDDVGVGSGGFFGGGRSGEAGASGSWTPPNPHPDFSPLGSGNIGGVMLRAAATVEGGTPSLADGGFSLMLENGDNSLDILSLRRFVTALWAVYFSEDGPGISIDPIDPKVDKHLVRYIGNIINSDLARVMREADYVMKKWAVGGEHPDIPGFKSVDEWSGRSGTRFLGASQRFWFVPEHMHFRLIGNALIFAGGHMTVKTEFIGSTNRAADPASESFASFFTEHYDEIAAKYPVFEELRDYAKLVALAQHLKEKKAPILWYLLANKDMILTEDSIGVVDALTKKSKFIDEITITGGVELAASRRHAHYLLDDSAAAALAKAAQTSLNGTPSTAWTFNAATSPDRSTPITIAPTSAVTMSSGAAGGNRVQTDLSLWHDAQPLLDLARYYDPDYEGPGTFGRGWHLLIPYRLESVPGERIDFADARVPGRFRVRNLLSGTEETLSFSESRRAIAGYVPDEASGSAIVGLFWMTDGTLRLADKLGGEYQFDREYRLTEMTLADGYTVAFEYGVEAAAAARFAQPPFQLRVHGDDTEQIGPISLPRRLELLGLDGEPRASFAFARDNSFDVVGYVPEDIGQSRWRFLAVLTNASFLLEDGDGTQVEFDGAGKMREIRTRVVRAMSRDNTRAAFDYEFADGVHRISRARVAVEGKEQSLLYSYDRDSTLSMVYLPSGRRIVIGYTSDIRGRRLVRSNFGP